MNSVGPLLRVGCHVLLVFLCISCSLFRVFALAVLREWFLSFCEYCLLFRGNTAFCFVRFAIVVLRFSPSAPLSKQLRYQPSRPLHVSRFSRLRWPPHLPPPRVPDFVSTWEGGGGEAANTDIDTSLNPLCPQERRRRRGGSYRFPFFAEPLVVLVEDEAGR